MNKRRPVNLLITVSFSSLLTVILLLYFSSAGWASADAADKKHASSCISCHRMQESEITATNAFPAGIDPSSICLDCHHYSDNHHPVNFIPEPGSTSSEETFPLFNREVRCLTCHTVHGTKGDVAKSKLLRGGPYTFRTEICFLCHDKDLNTKIDPHRMINDRGEIRRVGGKPVCLICHASVPDQTVEPPRLTFKADVAFLCWRCHPPMLDDSFFIGHFLVKPKEKTLEYMLRVQAERMVSFPLQPRDRITCSTCHNPHQKGVISSDSARAGEDAPHRLRMGSGGICTGCHDM